MSSPKIPDQNLAQITGALTDLNLYPFKSNIDALSQMGGKGVINGKTYDFTGLGNADVNAGVSDKMAQAMLDIQKNYGADYVKQRLADLQQSDPTGYAARKQLFDKIISDAQSNPDRPMANDLQKQVTDLLSQGSTLSNGPGGELEQVQQGVRGGQVARGNYLGNAATNQEASAVVNAGDQMQQQRQQKALGFLNSGVSPEDVTYRRIQQSLSNLGSAINGTTPEAQFGSLSGAQQGAAPFSPGNVQTASLNPNAGLQGLQNAASLYSGNVNWANAQANPWTTGLSTAANAASALSNMGWKPFGSTGFANNTYTASPATVGSGYGVLPGGGAATAADYAAGNVPG